MLEYGNYFSADEMRCKCGCGGEMPDRPSFQHLLNTLNSIRFELDKPIIINSGWRCENHPAERDKPSGPGYHNRFGAVDISLKGHDPIELLRLVLSYPTIRGLGINPGVFLHLDERENSTVWGY